KQLFTELGDKSGLARCLNNMALVLHRTHRDDEATKAFADGLQIAEQIGDTVAQAWLLQGWSYVLADQGELAPALARAQKKLALAKDRGVAPQSQAAAHANIAEILRWRGDLDGARQSCTIGDDLLRGIDARRFAAWIKYQLGEVEHAEDDLAAAQKDLE